MILLTAGVSSVMVGGLEGAVVAASDVDAAVGVSSKVVTLALVDGMVTGVPELPLWGAGSA